MKKNDLVSHNYLAEREPLSNAMSDRLFKSFSELIYRQCGIKMPPVKKIMLTSRLQKRLKTLAINSFEDYYNYLVTPEGHRKELYKMIDAVTTNKTDFFREDSHFNYLKEVVLPQMMENEKNRNRILNIWCAGCSTGEEAYTLSMVLSDFFNMNNKTTYKVMATDISTKVLESAIDAIYSADAINPIPLNMKKKYLLRGKGSRQNFFRVAPEIRQNVEFKRLNFMDKKFDINVTMDIIFCRNVVIYFDKKTQEELFRKFYDHLSYGGYLFIGHSETLQGVSDQFKMVAPTVYRKV